MRVILDKSTDYALRPARSRIKSEVWRSLSHHVRHMSESSAISTLEGLGWEVKVERVPYPKKRTFISVDDVTLWQTELW